MQYWYGSADLVYFFYFGMLWYNQGERESIIK